jgi:hypothetical protein
MRSLLRIGLLFCLINAVTLSAGIPPTYCSGPLNIFWCNVASSAAQSQIQKVQIVCEGSITEALLLGDLSVGTPTIVARVPVASFVSGEKREVSYLGEGFELRSYHLGEQPFPYHGFLVYSQYRLPLECKYPSTSNSGTSPEFVGGH